LNFYLIHFHFSFRAGFWHTSLGIPHFIASTGILRISHSLIRILWTSLNQLKFALSACPSAFVVSLFSLQPHLPNFWCQSFKASIASKGYPCMALTYPPILLFLFFFFTLDIYRPDGRTLRQFTMMTRTLTNGRNLTDGRTNAVFYYYCHST